MLMGKEVSRLIQTNRDSSPDGWAKTYHECIRILGVEGLLGVEQT